MVPAVAASYAAAEAVPAALEPAPAELSDPGVDVIEYAPAELSEPAPAAADQDDDAPPLEAFDSMPPADDQAEAEPADVATNVATAAAGPVTNAEETSSAGTASAMAAAGLPQAYLPGKSMAAMAGERSARRASTQPSTASSEVPDIRPMQ